MKSNTRIRIISIFVFAFALILIGRLYFLQIVDHDLYIQKGDRQYSSTSKKVFDRGTIFFQNKDGSLVSAATLRSGFLVAINPEVLKNPEDVYEKLNAILPLDKGSFIAKALKENDPYEELAQKVDTEVGESINALKIPGLQAYKERWRFYPGGNTASRIVGLLGYRGDEFAGRYGLERQYENNLFRKDGAYVNFFAEMFSDLRSLGQEKGEVEADIVTTIEPALQSYLQETLKDITSKWSAVSAGAIIMNPKTGEIYAMDVYPTFDLNNSQVERDISVFSNPLVENVYEMGSVIKPLTVAAGIDAGVITSKTTYYDPGFITVNNKRISNFDGKERGTVDMQTALSESLNVGMAKITTLLGNKLFSEYMYSFGIGEKTGIDLPNEGRNLVDNLKSPRDIEHVTSSFGQGLALTPISAIRSLSVLANGGFLVQPHIVKRIDYKMGMSKKIESQILRQVIKPETSEEISRMMVHSMDKVLLAGKLSLPNHSVAVKTGTAQISKSGGGGYYEDKFLHSFVGYFPAYDAKFIIFMYVVEPKGARFGSETLSLPFTDLTKFIVNYYEIPPDR